MESRVSIFSRPDTNKILFVVMRITRDSLSGKKVITVLSKTQTSGTIKKEYSDHADAENYLTVDLFDGEQIVTTITMEHPLYKQVEYADSTNVLISKKIVLDKADFFIRLPIHGNASLIRISETLKNKARQELTIIPL